MTPNQRPNWPSDLAIQASSSAVVFGSTSRERDEEEDAQQDVEGYGIAGRTWEAAYALRLYLEQRGGTSFNPPSPLRADRKGKGRQIIELGSGTGYLSLKLARSDVLGAEDRLVMTDLPEVLPLLERNLAALPVHESDVRVRALPWGEEEPLSKLLEETGTPDFVVAADLTYFEFLFAPLLRTLLGLTESGSTTVIMGYKVRSLTKENLFWTACGCYFHLEPVVCTPSLSTESQLHIFICSRRAETLKPGWTIPSSDADLLKGTGASGADQWECMQFGAMEDLF